MAFEERYLELTTPGKIILFGEHSVVYGKKAIAATLGLNTKLRLTLDKSNVLLQLPAVDLDETFPPDLIFKHFQFDGEVEPGDRVRATIQSFPSFEANHLKKDLSENQRMALIMIFHCLSYVREYSGGFSLRLETDLPVGSGAGSSASFSVAVSSAFLLLELSVKNKLSQFVNRGEDGRISLTDELMETVSKRAYACEKIFHGNPSGIDDGIILRGSVLSFVKSDCGNLFLPVDGDSIKVLLVDTKVPRSTKEKVALIRDVKNKYPEVFNSIFDAIGYISEKAANILMDMKRKPNKLNENEAMLAELIDLNHGLLRAIGVSHNSLESICSIAKKYKLSAKLTGAGGGGFGFVYIPHDVSISTIEDLKEELKTAGFDVYEVILGGPGLTITSLSL